MKLIIKGLHDATDRVIDQQSKRIAELETALTEIRADLDVQYGRLRVDTNWPQFKKLLGE